LAQRFEDSADAAPDKQVNVANYLSAAAYIILACSAPLKIMTSGNRPIARSSRFTTKRAALRIPAERVEYLFNGLGFSAYFRKAPGITRPPCVILLRGLDAAREIELHTIANFLLEKGLSTFAIDTAGRGETRFQGMKLLPDV
jgi:hypothetical protein